MKVLPAIDRRTLLIGGGVGVGLIVATWLAWPGDSNGLAVADDEFAFGSFIKIGRDGRVTVAVPQVETGQGIWTSLPQIVADELGAAWETVAVEPAPLASRYRNPLAGSEGWFTALGPLRAVPIDLGQRSMITAGASSIRAFAGPMRDAAAVARDMLVAAAASRWDIDASQCVAAGGFVSCAGQRLPFAALAEEAATVRAPIAPSLRSDREGRLAGQSLQRLDGPSKANGRTRFASDVRLPAMLHASVRVAPRGGRLTAFDRAAFAGDEGVRDLIVRDRWIAVVADDWHRAEQALHRSAPRFEIAADWADERRGYEDALENGAFATVAETGDFAAAVAERRPVAATYFVAPSTHQTLEPLSATARWTDGRSEIWLGTQAPGLEAATATADLFPLPVGGPDGRAFGNPLAPIALELAEQLRRPVQVTTPAQAARRMLPRGPGLIARMTARLREDGLPDAWRMRLVTENSFEASLSALAGTEPVEALGPLATRGAVPPYGIANLLVEAAPSGQPRATGYLRGSPMREACFVNESFVDELARKAGMEPLSFRMAMLGGNRRLAQCLQTAARLAGWDGGASGSNMGLACASAFGSAVALVATASIGADQRPVAHKLVAAVDCGAVVNRGLAEQQVEAAMMWALAQAGAASGLRATPEIVIRFIGTEGPPGGLSGLGAIPVAPAIANAIHSASGRRMRSLPFDPMAA